MGNEFGWLLNRWYVMWEVICNEIMVVLFKYNLKLSCFLQLGLTNVFIWRDVFSHNNYIFKVWVFFFSREILFYLFFQQGHIKWIKRDIKEVIMLQRFLFQINKFFGTFYSSWKKMDHRFHKNIHWVSAYRMISEALHHRNNYILKIN